MMDWHYNVDQENGHLLIEVEANKLIYRDDLLSHEKNKEIGKLLIQQELRYARISPLEDRAARHPMKRLHVDPDRAFEVVKALTIAGRLFRKKKQLFLDPFTTVDCIIEAEMGEGNELHLGSAQNMEWGFGGEEGFGIFNGVIRRFSRTIDPKWLVLPSILEGKEKEQFIERFREEDVPRAPKVIWKTAIPVEEPTPVPFLTLKDRTGGFADLWFDYGLGRKIARHEPKKYPWRSEQLEIQWEKDLLETEFVKKIVVGSQYYCPLDKVSSNLRFLIELGWSVIDSKGRTLVVQSAENWTLGIEGDKIIVKGKIAFGGEEAPIADYLNARKKSDLFLPLNDQSVGLLDFSTRSPISEIGDEFEIVQEGAALSKHHIGMVESLIQDPQIVKEPEIEALLQAEPVILSHFQGTLHPYQREGAEWLAYLYQKGWSGLLADEMGLGKTVQVLGFLSSIEKKGAALIVVPTSLLFHWKKEIERFLPKEPIHIHAGSNRTYEMPRQGIILTSYAILRRDSSELSRFQFDCIVLDEAQTIKNRESQVAEAACGLKAKCRLALTGTPVENRIDDLWSIFRFLMPSLFLGREEFLPKKVKPFILRRCKNQIEHELPPKLEQTIWVEMDQEQKSYYDDWLRKSKAGLIAKISADGAAKHRMEILETILRLRQICCHPNLIPGTPSLESGKFERVLEDLATIIAEKRKILLYSQFVSVLHLFEKEAAKRGWPYLILEGSTRDREGVVNAFQENKEIPLLLISLKAGGVGLNLNAADYVFLFDPWWNGAVENQAIDRAHRFGRKGTLIARRYIIADSIEEKMMELKLKKKHLSDQFLEAADSDLPIDELVDFLF